MTKTTLLTKEQATELFNLTVQYSQLSEYEQKQILDVLPMYRDILTKGHVDYVNNQFILTITY